MSKKIVFLLLIVFLLSISLVSAGFVDWFVSTFTGKVVVDVEGELDYCPEVTELQKRIDALERTIVAEERVRVPRGGLNEVCNEGGVCNENLVCLEEVCRDIRGTLGNTCREDGTCNDGLRCNDNNICEEVPQVRTVGRSEACDGQTIVCSEGLECSRAGRRMICTPVRQQAAPKAQAPENNQQQAGEPKVCRLTRDCGAGERCVNRRCVAQQAAPGRRR